MKTSLLMVTLLGWLCLQQATLASSLFNEALEQCKLHRYHAAADFLARAENQDPFNQQIHLYMGKILEILRQPDEARSEYEYCFRLNPFGKQGHLARQSILNLAVAQAAKENAPVDTSESIRQSIQIMQEQAQNAAGRFVGWGNADAAYRLNLGGRESAQYLQQARAMLEEMRACRIQDPVLESMIYEQALNQSHFAQTDSQVQSLHARRQAARAAADTQETVNNLVSQMGQERTLPDDAMLRAVGTNLYVRYYGTPQTDDIAPPDPPLELRAVPKRISCHNHSAHWHHT